jgi:hypothetical protein
MMDVEQLMLTIGSSYCFALSSNSCPPLPTSLTFAMVPGTKNLLPKANSNLPESVADSCILKTYSRQLRTVDNCTKCHGVTSPTGNLFTASDAVRAGTSEALRGAGLPCSQT